MEGLAADNAPQANDGIVLALFGQGERRDRQLQGSRDPVDVRVRDLALLQCPECAAEQALGDVLVVARDDDRDMQISAAQVRLVASLTQSQRAYSRWPSLSFLV